MQTGDESSVSGAAAPELTTLRMVMSGGQAALPARASLYPLHAGAYSEPLFTFELRPDQELPRMEPGGEVEVRGRLEKGSCPIVVAAGVEIVPAHGLVRGAGVQGSRLFAERGDVLAHPEVVGWQPGWRYVRSVSLESVEQWERLVRRDLCGGRVALVFAIAAFAGSVAGAYTAGPLCLAGLAPTLALYRLARRSHRALNEARDAIGREPAPMRMRLVWTVGHGQGPMANVILYAAEDLDGRDPVAYVAVVNVPTVIHSDSIQPCNVLGDPHRAPVIKVGDATLWPVELAHLLPGERRLRLYVRRV
jgi:hypothetical protein